MDYAGLLHSLLLRSYYIIRSIEKYTSTSHYFAVVVPRTSFSQLHRLLVNLITNGYEALPALEILHPLPLRFLQPRPNMPPLRSYLGYS